MKFRRFDGIVGANIGKQKDTPVEHVAPTDIQALQEHFESNPLVEIPELRGGVDAEHLWILMDLGMPDMDGFEVCRRLKADDRTRDIPVIFMTALSETEDKVRGFSIGAVDYITKPFNPDLIRARVRSLTWDVRNLLQNTRRSTIRPPATAVRRTHCGTPVFFSSSLLNQ